MLTKTYSPTEKAVPSSTVRVLFFTPTILEELRSIGTIPELQIKYSAVYNHENDVDLKYREYLVSGKLKKQKEDCFKNMPVDRIEELLNEPEEEDYQKKEAKLMDYQITRESLKTY